MRLAAARRVGIALRMQKGGAHDRVGARRFADRPMKPGTTAVIFVSQRAATDPEGYAAAAREMAAAVEKRPGYRGMHSARGADGVGITISYWECEAAAHAWKLDAAHTAIRDRGRSTWYEWYETIIADVTRSYGWRKEMPG